MPANKNAISRHLVIDKCLSNRGRKWTWKDILEEVNKTLDKENMPPVGKTTIFQDFKDIERIYEAELDKFPGEHKKVIYYRYMDPDFSIRKQPLSDHEAAQIRSAMQVLGRFKGMPQFEWVNEMIPMLETKMGISAGKPLNIMTFDNNEDYKGLDHIESFFNAILYKRPLTVLYKDFKSPVSYEIEFHPYHLKQYNHRWFVFGHDPYNEKRMIQTLALDRIIELKEKETSFLEMEINWENYFEDFIGVTKMDEPVQEVKLLIHDSEQAAYIETKPLHQTQKRIRKTEMGLETTIQVIPNIELIKLLLSYGSRIEVLTPRSLRNAMKSHAEKMRGLYNSI
jgi:predicted DNA-binding transcriptional regulator YafY